MKLHILNAYQFLSCVFLRREEPQTLQTQVETLSSLSPHSNYGSRSEFSRIRGPSANSSIAFLESPAPRCLPALPERLLVSS
ncbi:hypothetical protein AVEN_242310-1 [Araneus ventricosus]|uniref:Uncharacterized protein n=1 Tax=Araneus ventricosus TaxID=182803 RepID=A0A4Y2UX64_ARAVE|nr:hypothetical protein AVEN_197291-1 [Araneus ventricosus]GBO16914.1 hypothetical protein AVEN_242310-1 [Araneus ventricosus]